MTRTPEQILKDRARLLARPSEVPVNPAEQLGVVVFSLAAERYAIEEAHVREVYPLKDLTPMPCTPAFMLGVINVRGQIIAVYDLRRFFDLPPLGLTDLNKVIILESDETRLGIMADAILGVRLLLLADIQPPLPTLTGIHGKYLRGVTRDRLVVLDANRILTDEKIIINEEVEE